MDEQNIVLHFYLLRNSAKRKRKRGQEETQIKREWDKIVSRLHFPRSVFLFILVYAFSIQETKFHSKKNYFVDHNIQTTCSIVFNPIRMEIESKSSDSKLNIYFQIRILRKSYHIFFLVFSISTRISTLFFFVCVCVCTWILFVPKCKCISTEINTQRKTNIWRYNSMYAWPSPYQTSTEFGEKRNFGNATDRVK